MRTLIQAIAIVVASAALFACKPREEASDPVASDEEAAPEEEVVAADANERVEACNLTITLQEAVEVTTYWAKAGGEPSGARSIHWANAEEKGAQPTNNGANPLELVCASSGSPNVTLTLTALTSSESDVPMDPGSYPIRGMLQVAAKPGEFVLKDLRYEGRAFDAKNGTLVISNFDSRGVEGSFTIDGLEVIEAGAPIHVEGTFEIPCHGGAYESACQAN